MAHRGGSSRRNQDIDTTITSVQCDGLVSRRNINGKMCFLKMDRLSQDFTYNLSINNCTVSVYRVYRID